MPSPAPHDGAAQATVAHRPIAVDLFAGAGGLSLGLEQAGFDVAAAVEYDPVHVAAHRFNFPKTAILCADISTLAAETLTKTVAKGLALHGRDAMSWDGEIDLVAGGPPCQGFSLIGKRLIDDTRNRLVFHFFRLVATLKPRYFVMENVPGMATGGHTGILEELIKEFEGAGYRFPSDEKYRVLNAADFGVPQDRRRVFLIGSRSDQPIASHPTPTVRPVLKRPSPVQTAKGSTKLSNGPTVWDAIGDLPNVNDFPRLRSSDETRLSAQRLKALEDAASPYARKLRGVETDSADFSYPRSWNRALLTASMRTSHTKDSIKRFKATACGDTEPVSRFYKLHPEGLCNTLRAGSGSERGAFTSPRPLHPEDPRVLSNREAARLHSFPDWFRPHATKWHGFRQIGNAVPPLLARAVAARIVEKLGVSPSRPDEPVELGSTDLLWLAMSKAANRFDADTTSIPAPRVRSGTAKSAGKGHSKRRHPDRNGSRRRPALA